MMILLAFLSLGAQEPDKPWPVVPGLPVSGISLTAADKGAVLEAVCPSTGRVETTTRGAEYVCRSCPEGSQPMGFDEESARLGHALAGHFTAPGVEERLVWFWGCGPNQNPGFSVLFQRNGERWRKVWIGSTDSALSSCYVHPRPTGRDLLICYRGLWQRGFALGGPVQIELDTHGVRQRGDLYTILSGAVRGSTGNSVMTVTREQATLIDINGDGVPDLRVLVTVHQGPGPTDPKDTRRVAPPVVSRQNLVFLYRDGLFYPTPATKRAIEVLERFWAKGNPDG